MNAVSTRPSIAIVVAYFGSPPPWLPAFFRSCQTNADVQWLLFTDFDVPAPANVRIERMDLRELSARASAVVGAPVSIERSGVRKICDFKPLYGRLFADHLRGFDVWAHSDLDVIWGDIRQFATDELLNGHIIVSPRQRKLGGHGTFWRNTEANNRLYEIVPDVREHLTNPAYVRLDENILTRHLRDRIATSSFKARPKIYWEEEMTISAEYQKALLAGDRDWSMPWRNGRAFDADGREVMYLHFHKLERCMQSIDFDFSDEPDEFRLTRHGIVRN